MNNNQQHLITGGDDHFLPQLINAINNATHIDMAVAFIRMTGLELIKDALQEACEREVSMRILTGDYLGVTEPQALRQLMLLKEEGAKVKIFESKDSQSFHMKAYIFATYNQNKQLGGQIFVGSSNLSKSALQTGLEWNLRVDWKENPQRFEEICNKFEVLYKDENTITLTHKWIDQYQKKIRFRPKQPVTVPGADEELEIPPPRKFQKEALEALERTRVDGFKRGLVVMASGMGKTWLSAFDTEQASAERVLFVAHREEILNQAESTFVKLHPNSRVGKYTGKEQETDVDMLFASIQTLGKLTHLNNFPKDHFDYIIVDEFHHAAARTYKRLLRHFEPDFLLGLTATPDRTDQADILTFCDNNLVYQRDLFDGIEGGILCPFHYYGIADKSVNYQAIPWRSGRFDPTQLSNKLATKARAEHVINEWRKQKQKRTLAFCVSQKHSDFMADYFKKKGISAVSVHSDSDTRRNEALSYLRKGQIDIIFSVDLFNEGIDLKAIDTVLMLRPTESKILFLQQLGRGLRTCDNKDHLVVQDFIGNHKSFFRKPEALFGIGVTNKERKDFLKKVKSGRLNLPDGCFINVDLEAINFMEEFVKNRIDSQVELYQDLQESHGSRPSIAEFYQAGGKIQTVRQEYGQWFSMVESQNDLNQDEINCLSSNFDFFAEIEKTPMTKSYKMILLKAMLELDGFLKPTTTEIIARKSFEIIKRHRPLQYDLPEEFKDINKLNQSDLSKWHSYWKGNPINAWIGGNRNTGYFYFELNDGIFKFKDNLFKIDFDVFEDMVQELIDYRLLQYESRLQQKKERDKKNKIQIAHQKEKGQKIPFFKTLRIACGHFKTGDHNDSNLDYVALPISYGNLNPAKHFIARADGNSMDGGVNPIKNGDYLLMELITSESAGSITGNIMAVERYDVGGDGQYVLRKINKLGPGKYELVANNPNYESFIANDEMRQFARLKGIIEPEEIFLHQTFMREDIPPLFGLEFKAGLWQTGHVCPKETEDQYLFVTLNKQGHQEDHKYLDRFIDESTFHWQSQRNTTVRSKKGQSIVNHESNGSKIYLFVRKYKLKNKKAAPFYFCGPLRYESHTGEKPMNVVFSLEYRLNKSLGEYFGI